jgi:carotenoid cleavage dioxygenase-like enzyme
MFSPPALDNANVNLTRLGDEYIAMTETPIAVRFDPQTLATLGPDKAAAQLGQVTTAHPHHDPARDEFLNFTVDMGPRSRYRLFARASTDAGDLREIGSKPVREPAYMHSFAMTENHLLLIEPPLVVQPVRLIASLTVLNGSFIEQYRWKPELGLRIHAFDRATGTHTRSWKSDPCFLFHTINAYEQDGAIRLDFCAFKDASIIHALELDRLRAGDDSFTIADPPTATRLTLPLGPGEVERTVLSDEIDIELPRIDYRRRNGRPYRYVYGNSQGEAAFLKDIVKLDVESGRHHAWSEPDQWAGEPVFVPRPGGEDEDDGVLMSVVMDGVSGDSYLLVLDAADLSELARARAPQRVPFGFHGQFFSR